MGGTFSVPTVVLKPETNEEFIVYVADKVNQEGEVLLTDLEKDYIKLILDKCGIVNHDSSELDNSKIFIQKAFKERVDLIRKTFLEHPDCLYMVDELRVKRKPSKMK